MMIAKFCSKTSAIAMISSSWKLISCSWKWKKKKDYLTNLPSEIITNILSRLSARAVLCCKCVCKSLLNLIKTDDYFARSHLSKSVPCLTIHTRGSGTCTILEFEDKLDNELKTSNLVTKFGLLPQHGFNLCSVNGLILLHDPSIVFRLFICNPITREYIQLDCPVNISNFFLQSYVTCHGFGVSKMSGQHKLVSISQDPIYDHQTKKFDVTKFVCNVYTLGTGLWRSIAAAPPSIRTIYTDLGVFVNGKLHWLLLEYLNVFPSISCFDLETELFSSLVTPDPINMSSLSNVKMCALGDCLCLFYHSLYGEVVIWLMKEYGVKKSWTKEYVINTRRVMDFCGGVGIEYPIKILRDGLIFMNKRCLSLFYYSKRDNTICRIDTSQIFPLEEQPCNFVTVLHTSSFLQMKRSFQKEIVGSFFDSIFFPISTHL